MFALVGASTPVTPEDQQSYVNLVCAKELFRTKFRCLLERYRILRSKLQIHIRVSETRDTAYDGI